MADEVDLTAARAEIEAPYLIAASRRPVGPQANGFCHWCDEEIAEGLRFCDASCSSDWQHERDVRRKQGSLA